MNLRIPFDIGLFSGLSEVPDGVVTFRDEAIMKKFTDSLFDDVTFTVSGMASRKPGGELVLRELRLIPMPKVQREEPPVERVAASVANADKVCKHHEPGGTRCNMNNLQCTYPKCLEG
jgi:hypothetical protein